MPRLLIRALRLPLRRKILFARVSLLLVSIHLGLRVLPFARFSAFLKRWRKPLARPRTSAVDDVCWAVARAGRFWLGDSGCLAQALLGELMLIRRGVDARMRIGVRKDPASGALLAHAWVEDTAGQVWIGGRASLDRFQNFPEIQRILEQRGRA